MAAVADLLVWTLRVLALRSLGPPPFHRERSPRTTYHSLRRRAYLATPAGNKDSNNLQRKKVGGRSATSDDIANDDMVKA